MPEASVISIAKKESDLNNLKEVLKKQTFKNFEFVYSTKKGIPNAWNDAINRAKGKILVFTESDALPLSNKWLEEMVKAVKLYNKKDSKKRTVIRGIEIISLPWDFANFACYSSVFKKIKLDETFPVAEDTEFFSKLKHLGYKGKELPIASVVHTRSISVSKLIKNNFLYGMLLVRIQMKYGQTGFKTTFKGNFQKSSLSFLKRELGITLSKIMFFIGAIIGLIIYSSSRKK